MRISLKFVPSTPIENNHTLVQIMFIGAKSSSESMMASFTAAYTRHSALVRKSRKNDVTGLSRFCVSALAFGIFDPHPLGRARSEMGLKLLKMEIVNLYSRPQYWLEFCHAVKGDTSHVCVPFGI